MHVIMRIYKSNNFNYLFIETLDWKDKLFILLPSKSYVEIINKGISTLVISKFL